jgi:hypothetical protein
MDKKGLFLLTSMTAFVDDLQAKARYTFTLAEAMDTDQRSDHDLGDESQYDHEASGVGRIVGKPADEGDTVFVDHHSGPNR